MVKEIFSSEKRNRTLFRAKIFQGGIRMKFRGLLLAAVMGVTLCLSGCPSFREGQPVGIALVPPLFAAGPEAAASAVSTKPTAAGPEAAASAVSEMSASYAESIGGTDQNGETLFFIIGASLRTEAGAQKALDRAIPLFGDMQSYFTVQRSDSFEGMRAGWWIVTEAYRKTPSPENLDFARRAFPDAYVKRAVVKVSSLIPVYEDLVDAPQP